MKNLFLLRHANATNDGNNDFDRCLTEEGIAECKKAAEILNIYIKDIDLFLISH